MSGEPVAGSLVVMLVAAASLAGCSMSLPNQDCSVHVGVRHDVVEGEKRFKVYHVDSSQSVHNVSYELQRNGISARNGSLGDGVIRLVPAEGPPDVFHVGDLLVSSVGYNYSITLSRDGRVFGGTLGCL